MTYEPTVTFHLLDNDAVSITVNARAPHLSAHGNHTLVQCNCIAHTFDEAQAMIARALEPQRVELKRQEAIAMELFQEYISFMIANGGPDDNDRKCTALEEELRLRGRQWPDDDDYDNAIISVIKDIHLDLAALDEPRDSEGRTRDECIASVGDKWNVSETAREPHGDTFWDNVGHVLQYPNLTCIFGTRFILTPKHSPELAKWKEQREALDAFHHWADQLHGERVTHDEKPSLALRLDNLGLPVSRDNYTTTFYNSTKIDKMRRDLDAKIKAEEAK